MTTHDERPDKDLDPYLPYDYGRADRNLTPVAETLLVFQERLSRQFQHRQRVGRQNPFQDSGSHMVTKGFHPNFGIDAKMLRSLLEV